MALYALDFSGIIPAADAQGQGKYRCIECNLPLQLRQGRRTPHFYHVKTAPHCRLYSKSEAHLLIQLQIQTLFAKNEIFLEKPFPSIARVADACWEAQKIIFEIQCSLLAQREAENRINDYKALGYTVVWLLDDRIFNQKILRSTENFFRMHPCYYVHYQKKSRSIFYDQFEIFEKNKRIKKSIRLNVQLTEPRQIPKQFLQNHTLKQILNRLLFWPLFFQGDIFHKTLLSAQNRPLAITLQNWKHFEEASPEELALNTKKLPIKRKFIYPFWRFFEWLLQKVDT